MAKINKIAPKSTIQNALSNKDAKVNKIKDEGTFNISFKDLDTSQKYGSSFLDWQNCGWLSKMLETLKGYCHKPLYKQFDDYKFVEYKKLPPRNKCHFVIPSNIPEDAKWARIHILNKVVVVGHYVENTFYVVFLDKTHKFWETKK